MTGAPVTTSASRKRARSLVLAVLALAVFAVLTSAAAAGPPGTDERTDLTGGYLSWDEAAKGVDHVDNDPRVPPFDAPPGNFGFVNSDLAIQGDRAFVGGFNGYQVYDISDPDDPVLEASLVCPGGQGDLSVYGDLLFMSVEETRGRIDCGTQGAPGPVNLERFRGVRIFDISDIDNPVQLPGVQTCRGSHTHTLVTDPNDPDTIYVYNSGTSGVRPAAELAGCENAAPTTEPVTTGNPTQWRIDVIAVPLDNPASAAIVNQPRIFTDPTTGAFNGLQNTQTGTLHPSGVPYAPLPNTNTCHDMTAYPEIGLAAGACQGNGVLLDISDPEAPVRVDAVSDPNFSYWHSATFSNDGSKVIFTDEWGGGTSARCRATDDLSWGADAIFDIVDGKMEFRSFWKLPVSQGTNQNCVAHNGNIVPVPGRDILSQAWYQGGHVLVDFTDSENPKEIAYYDRGYINEPNTNPAVINLGGFWSTYFYNGRTYGSEIARGFDTLKYTETDDLSANEILAAGEPELTVLNAQLQSEITHDPSFAVVRSYRDQLARAGTLKGNLLTQTTGFINRAERFSKGAQVNAVADQLNAAADNLVGPQYAVLRQALRDLAATY